MRAPRSQELHEYNTHTRIDRMIGVDLDAPHMDARRILQFRHISIGLREHIFENGLG